jgi:hypothetical protein
VDAAGHLTQLVDDAGHARLHLRQLHLEFRRRGGYRRGGGAEHERERYQPLLDAVVQIPFEPARALDAVSCARACALEMPVATRSARLARRSSASPGSIFGPGVDSAFSASSCATATPRVGRR